MPTTQTVPNCNSTFTITVQNQDGYWPKSIFFDRNGNGTGTDYNSVESENMPIGTPWENNTYPKYYRTVRQCDFSGTSTDAGIVTDAFYYIDKANYLNSNNTQMTTMNYIVDAEYKCCYYLMVDLYSTYTWTNNGWQSIIGDCATIFRDSFYINWTAATNQYDMIIGMHIPLSAGYFSYDSNTGLINNTASANGFSDVYEGVTTYATQLVTPSITGLRGIGLHVQSTSIPEIPYITYTVSRYKRMENRYRDVQIVFVQCDATTNSGQSINLTSYAAAHTLSPCVEYDIATDATSTPARPWLTPNSVSSYSRTLKTLSINGSGGTAQYNFLNSDLNIIKYGNIPNLVIRMWVQNGVLGVVTSYANLISSLLTKAVNSTYGDSHINIGDYFYDARDGKIKYRMLVQPANPDRIYDSSNVFYDTDALPNVIALVDCDNEGNEEIRSILPNDPDYIGVETSLTVDNHGMFKFISANNGVLYTFFKTLTVGVDGLVYHYYFNGSNEPIIDCEWTFEGSGRTTFDGCYYDAYESSYFNTTYWMHIDSPSQSTGMYTNFPDYYNSSDTDKIYLYAYEYNVVDIDTTPAYQITDYTYDSLTGVATITVNGTVYTSVGNEYTTQLDYYELQTEYVMYQGEADTSNALAPSTSSDSGVNRMYCSEEGAPHTLIAMGNYGGHVVGWQAINGPQLSTSNQVSTGAACCDVITPLVEYGYERPVYYYVIKNSDYTHTVNTPINPIPPINTYGLKRCAQPGYNIYNFLRYVNSSVGYVPRKSAIFGTGTPILEDYVPEDAIQSVFIALVKISDGYLQHNEDGNVIGLPDDLSCGDIIYGGDGLSDYMRNGFIDDGSVYIFVYARPTVSNISGNIASYNVIHGPTVGGLSPTIENIDYTLRSLAEDDTYSASHDSYYQGYLQAPLFMIETNATSSSGDCGTFYYNDEIIASFSQIMTDNECYVVPNSYLNYNEFPYDGGYYRASASHYDDGILYYDVSALKASQKVYLNSYFFTKQNKIRFETIDNVVNSGNTTYMVNKPYGFSYLFPMINNNTLQLVRKHASYDINKLTRWLPKGVCTKGVWGSSTRTIDGQMNNTVMFHQAKPESIDYLSLTITFTPSTPSGSVRTLTFSVTQMAADIDAGLSMTTPSLFLYDVTYAYNLLGTIETRNGIPYITNLQIENASNHSTYAVYGTIRVIQMDEIYDEDYFPYRMAGYTFSDFRVSGGYSDIVVFDDSETYFLSTSIINGWNVIHTYLNEESITGTDGCGVGDEDYIAKIWPYTLDTDGDVYTDNIRIKIHGYTPTSSDWEQSTSEDVEQNMFLSFKVEPSNASSPVRYYVTLRFYDIVNQYFQWQQYSNDISLPIWYVNHQPSINNDIVPYYLETTLYYLTKDYTSTITTDSMYDYLNDITTELSAHIEFDETTSEVVLKNVLGDIRVETSWKFGVYNHNLTTNDTNRHTIYYYNLSTPITLSSEVYNGNTYIPNYAGYIPHSYPSSTGIESNRTFDEIADRYEVIGTPTYTRVLPSIHFNIDYDTVVLAYAGYNTVISPNTLYIPSFEIDSSGYNNNDLENCIAKEFSFGNINGGSAGSVNSNKVVLRQSTRYVKEGNSSNMWDVYATAYMGQNYSLHTSFAFNVMGNPLGRYLQVKCVYSNSRKMFIDINCFGRFYFIFNNGTISDAMCDFGTYLESFRYGDVGDYTNALDVLQNLNILVYNVTESDNLRKYIFEIGPLPLDARDYCSYKDVICGWNHLNGESYYYNSINGTQNFIYDYRFIDGLSTPSSNSINLEFYTDSNTYSNTVFKAYTNFDASNFDPYDTITIKYDEATQ